MQPLPPLALASLLLGSPAVGLCQTDTGRTRILGEVRGQDGSTWTNAEVTLLGEPSIRIKELGGLDRIVVKTGKRGRFRARILADRSYRAWATLTTDEGTRITDVRSEIVPGRPVQLMEAAQQPMRIQVEVFGLDAWKQHGLRLTINESELVLDDSGRARLPFLPGSICWLYGWTGDRRILSRLIGLMREAREVARRVMNKSPPGKPVGGLPELSKLPLADLAVERVLIPPPIEVTIRVVDKESKKPIPGASIVVLDGRNSRTVGVSDAEGRAALVIAHPIGPFGRHRNTVRHEFFAQAEGYALARTGWSYSGSANRLMAAMIVNGKAPELTIELDKGFSLRGEILVPEGISASDIALVYSLSGGEQRTQNSYRTIRLRAQIVRSDEAGRWQVHGLSQQRARLEIALLLPKQLVAVLTNGQPYLPHTGRLPLAIPNLYGLSEDISNKIDLRKLRAIDISLEFPDGHKAAHAEVRVLPANGRVSSRSYIPEELRCGIRGRFRIFTAEARPLLIAHADKHYLVAELEESAKSPTLTLKPCAVFTGRLLDAKRRPVEGGRLRVYLISMLGGSDRFQNYKSTWNQRSLSGTTDADGRFSLYWIPSPGTTYGIRATVRVADQSFASHEQLTLSTESVENAELTINADVEALTKKKK